MQKLQKLGGTAAILQAGTYIILFIVFGAILQFPPKTAPAAEQLNFLSDNYALLISMNIIGYVLFGILLAVSTLALYQRFNNKSPILAKTAAVFGFIWVALIIASGMISNVGLEKVINISIESPERALEVWSVIGIIGDGLGGGNEIVGGLWVLLLSFAGLRDTTFSKPVVWIGMLVGTAGLLTVFPEEIIKVIFGLTQIVWFIWIGIFLIRERPESANKVNLSSI